VLATGADQQVAAPSETPAGYATARFARDAASLFACIHPQLDLLH
jgi:hypothetical protein